MSGSHGERYSRPMPNVGPMELVIVFVIALIVLGPKRLPEVGRSIGSSMREFKDAVSGVKIEDEDEDEDRELTATKS
jgi:sec-independent protein translocase protein TatA